MLRFRGDIEGLRAIAVLLVVFDHLEVPGFSGGYIGVDVFFVLSGYLITSLLAAEYAKKAEGNGGRGSISIPGFYARRARRILPAALTVIVTIVVAGGILLNELRVAQINHDAIWAVFFGSNVNFIRQATDYFAQGFAATSPFQHYWSLAVEEQFYLVWPALFLLVTRPHGLTVVGIAIRWRARVALTVCAVGLASLTWSIVATAQSPVSAYFSTFTRAWELALGALIGIVATSATRLPGPLARVASAGGVLLFVAACAAIGRTTPFPGAAALLPTTATALLIVGGLTARAPLPNRLLCIPPLRFLGRISYSVYLWHWPLVVFASALYPTMSETVQMRLLILFLTLAISALSFYLVEQPGRRVSFGQQRGRGRAPGRSGVRNLGTAVFGTCVLAAVFVGVFSTIAPERSVAAPVSRTNPASSTSSAGGGSDRAAIVMTVAGAQPRDTRYVEAVRAWQRQVRAGIALRRLPQSLQPLQPHLSGYIAPPCIRRVTGASSNECVVGNPTAKHVAVLTGDSHAGMFQNAVSRAFDRNAWSVHIFQRAGCGWAGDPAPNPNVSAAECRSYQAEALRRIRELRPEVLLLSEDRVVTPFRSVADMSSSLATHTRLAKRTIVLGHTPRPIPFTRCLVGSADISGCSAPLHGDFPSYMRLEQRLTTRSGGTFVDTSSWFCAATGTGVLCPSVIGGAPVFKDGDHIAAGFEPKLVPVIRAMLASAGVATFARDGA